MAFRPGRGRGEEYARVAASLDPATAGEHLVVTTNSATSAGRPELDPGEDPGTFPNFRRARLWKIVSICLAPIPVAVAPVVLPFGDPYISADCVEAAVGANRTNDSWCPHAPMDIEVFQHNVSENWVYFFWYTPVGWAQLWLAITYWSSSCLGHLKVPIYVEHPGRVILCATLCACMIYTAGGFIVFPFPLGTFSLGLPTFGCFFACLVCGSMPTGEAQAMQEGKEQQEEDKEEVCEAEDKEEEEKQGEDDGDFLAIMLRICMYWTAWIFMLFFLVKLKNLDSDSLHWKILVKVGFVVAPFLARGVARIASEDLLETGNEFFGAFPSFALWWVYSVAVFKNFIMSGNGSLVDARNLATVQVILFLITRIKVRAVVNASIGETHNSKASWIWRHLCPKSKVKDRIEDLIEEGLSEMLAPLHFAPVLLFNCFGPNSGKFYVLDTLGPTGARNVAIMMFASSLFKALSLGWTIYELQTGLQHQPEKSTPDEADKYKAALEEIRKQLQTIHSVCPRMNGRSLHASSGRVQKHRHIMRVVVNVLREKFQQDEVESIVKQLARHETASEFLDRVVWLLVDRDWLRLILLFAASITIVGSCMVMRHDGMDMSFEFEWLPNNVAKTSHTIVNLVVKMLFGLWFATLLWRWVSDHLRTKPTIACSNHSHPRSARC